jgi:phytoene synthase
MNPSTDLNRAYAVAESIASRDLNNLYLVSRFFADPLRYRAFSVFYAVMRCVDDRVDDLSARRGVSHEERTRVRDEVAAWRGAIRALYRGDVKVAETLAGPDAPGNAALLVPAFEKSLSRYPLPWKLWENFFDAMDRDLANPRFDTYRQFLEYAEGATVAPTTIYLFLLSSRPESPGAFRYRPPDGFDVMECGRQLGLFAYLTHILRDLPQDLAAGEEGLLYLARDDMDRFGVTREVLQHCLATRGASESLRRLLEELSRRARAHLKAGRALLDGLAGELAPDCAFILELIVGIYKASLERIAAQGFDPFPERHHLGLREKQRIILATARQVDFPVDSAWLTAGQFISGMSA